MVHNTPPNRLSEVIAAALDEVQVTLRQAEDRTGIPRTTLTRRIHRGGWTVAELEALAPLLNTSVVALLAKAEVAA